LGGVISHPCTSEWYLSVHDELFTVLWLDNTKSITRSVTRSSGASHQCVLDMSDWKSIPIVSKCVTRKYGL